MAKGSKPRAGSRAFWPRKRASRIYQSFDYSPTYLELMKRYVKETKPLMFSGYKAGMTYVMYTETKKSKPTYMQEINVPVTIIECPPLRVMGLRIYENKNGRFRVAKTILSENLERELERKIKLPGKEYFKKAGKEVEKWEKIVKEHPEKYDVRLLVHTAPKEGGISKKKPEVFEIDLSGSSSEKFSYAKEKLGKLIRREEVFREGEYVDVRAVTKGKGFQGVVKRFGVKERGRKADKKMRHIGALAPRNVARVLPNSVAMPGQLGFHTRTEYSKLFVKGGKEGLEIKGGIPNYGVVRGEYMLIAGSVPGPKKRLVMMRKAVRKPDKLEPIQVTHVSTEPQN